MHGAPKAGAWCVFAASDGGIVGRYAGGVDKLGKDCQDAGVSGFISKLMLDEITCIVCIAQCKGLFRASLRWRSGKGVPGAKKKACPAPGRAEEAATAGPRKEKREKRKEKRSDSR